MGTVDLETLLLVVTILGGAVALLLALLQMFDTYIDIGDKLRKRRKKDRAKGN